MLNIVGAKAFKKIPTVQNINKMKIPVTLLTPNDDNAAIFNQLLKYVKDKKYKQIVLTRSGGISNKKLIVLPAYSYTWSQIGAELVILEKYAYRIQFRHSPDTDSSGAVMSGTKAFWKFLELCKEYGIDIQKYIVENGKEITATIQKPLIRLGTLALTDIVYSHAHHIDWHSSYGTGLAITHPEFYPLINDLYENRKKEAINKAILNYTIGMFHSRNIGWKYATLAKDAIADNNERVLRLAAQVEQAGGMILLFNTDGFWYTGCEYHDELEGDRLGMWHHDHIDCKLRIKSAGAYEYIEDGQYIPVIRGMTGLDRLKDRKDWQWGDIYEAPIIKYILDADGIHMKEDEDGQEDY